MDEIPLHHFAPYSHLLRAQLAGALTGALHPHRYAWEMIACDEAVFGNAEAIQEVASVAGRPLAASDCSAEGENLSRSTIV